MGYIVNIDKDKCIGCGACVKDCPASHLRIEDKKAVIQNDMCIGCGHCYAICPKEAVAIKNYDMSETHEIVPFTSFNSEEFLKAIRSRRTIRQFENKAIEQEKIDKIIEAGRSTNSPRSRRSASYSWATTARSEAWAARAIWSSSGCPAAERAGSASSRPSSSTWISSIWTRWS